MFLFIKEYDTDVIMTTPNVPYQGLFIQVFHFKMDQWPRWFKTLKLGLKRSRVQSPRETFGGKNC